MTFAWMVKVVIIFSVEFIFTTIQFLFIIIIFKVILFIIIVGFVIKRVKPVILQFSFMSFGEHIIAMAIMTLWSGIDYLKTYWKFLDPEK